MIKAIIFDLDGVLVSSDQFHKKAWQAACESWKLPFFEQTADRLRGVSRMDSARILLEAAGQTLTDGELNRFAEEKNERYIASLAEMTEQDILPGVLPLLSELKQAGIPAAVASSSKNARLILKKTGLTPYFDAIVDGWAISRSKPDPEVFQRAAEALHTAPKDCLVVEDAVSGVQAALAMGARAAGLGAAAAAAGVTYPLQQMSDLHRLLFRQ